MNTSMSIKILFFSSKHVYIINSYHHQYFRVKVRVSGFPVYNSTIPAYLCSLGVTGDSVIFKFLKENKKENNNNC